MLQISSNGVGPTSKQNIQRHACGIQLSKHVQKSRKALASNQLWHGVVFVARSSIRHSCLSFLEQPFRLSSDTVFLEVSVCIQLRWENLIIMPDLSRIGTFCFTRKGAALQVSSRDLYYISFWGMFGEDPQLTHQKLKVTRQARQATVTRFRSHAGHVPSRKSCGPRSSEIPRATISLERVVPWSRGQPIGFCWEHVGETPWPWGYPFVAGWFLKESPI